MLDWNWYFSGLAQSSAAIVGFFGGFVISKIITREGEYNRLQERLQLCKNRALEQKHKLERRRFHWYNKRMRDIVRESDDFKSLVVNGKETPDYEDIISQLNYSPFDSEEDLRAEIDTYWATNNPAAAQGPVSPNIGIISSQTVPMIVEERELINREVTATEALSVEVRNQVADMISFPKGGRITKVALTLVSVLFLAGVVYPLALTPAEGEPQLASFLDMVQEFFSVLLSFRGILLSVIGITFFTIVGLFWALESRHSFPMESINELNEATSIES